MTVHELSEVVQCRLKVKSGYNGKVLCQMYRPEKHQHIAKRMVCSAWAELEVTDVGFGNYAKPLICCFVDGAPEAMAAIRKEDTDG